MDLIRIDTLIWVLLKLIIKRAEGRAAGIGDLSQRKRRDKPVEGSCPSSAPIREDMPTRPPFR